MTDYYSASPIEIEDTDPPHYGRDWQADRMPGRFANVSIVGASLASEAGVRAAVAKLTAWLDAPRLAAREKAEVIAAFGYCSLIRSSTGEWGVTDRIHGLPIVQWFTGEADARTEFILATDTNACELCGAYRDDHDVDEDGIYTCTDEHEAACEAARAKKGPTP